MNTLMRAIAILAALTLPLATACTAATPAQTQNVQGAEEGSSSMDSSATPGQHIAPEGQNETQGNFAQPSNGGTPEEMENAGSNLLTADETALNVVTTMWTLDGSTDLSPMAGQRRASALMSEKLATATNDAGDLPGGAWWNEIAAHKATTTVTASLSAEVGQPPDTLTVAYRSIEATVQASSADGWTNEPRLTITRLVLSRRDTASPWKVTDLSIS